jgi:SAM-dependent methyltransferase
VRARSLLAVLAIALALAGAACSAGAGGTTLVGSPSARRPDVPYEPTPPAVVEAMLDLAGVRADDVVYDLGCGDGRIVVAAARRGARAVGVDIDPERVREARESARAAQVADRVTVVEGDLFEADVSDASVVMLYLWPAVNLRLRPRLLAQLRPGARVVSHSHDMGDWKPTRTVAIAGRTLHLWVIAGPPDAR